MSMWTYLNIYSYILKHYSNDLNHCQCELEGRVICSFPVAQLVEHGASNAKIMGSIPRESKSW